MNLAELELLAATAFHLCPYLKTPVWSSAFTRFMRYATCGPRKRGTPNPVHRGSRDFSNRLLCPYPTKSLARTRADYLRRIATTNSTLERVSQPRRPAAGGHATYNSGPQRPPPVGPVPSPGEFQNPLLWIKSPSTPKKPSPMSRCDNKCRPVITQFSRFPFSSPQN